MVEEIVEYPLISCLCVTKNKVRKLETAIQCFNYQTYPNRELMLLYEDNDYDTANYLMSQPLDPRIKVIEIKSEPKLTLGELRNMSILKSNGEYFCQWDDDDWYHPERMMTQFQAIKKSKHPASILTHWLIYDSILKQAYFSHANLWEGSIMCKKAIVNSEIRYASKEKGEDLYFVNQLLKNSNIFPIVAPNLYIYVYHGHNTWNLEHFKNMFADSQKLSTHASILIGDIIDNKYSVVEASMLLESESLLIELCYLHAVKVSLPNTNTN